MKIALGNYEMELIHHDPKLYSIKGVITQQECKHFQEISSAFMKRSTVSAINKNKDKEGALDKRRTSTNCWVKHDHSEITLSVGKRIAELIQLPLENAESYQVLHYGSAQEYQPHMDTFDPNTDLGKSYLGSSGQRIITVLCYLNDVSEGGSTVFPNINKEVFPEAGKIAVFHNCFPGTDTPNPGSLHGASPVLSGEKWAINLWFRKNKVEQEH